MEREGTETARRVGTARTAMEDYALRQVPATWSWPWPSVVSAILGAGTAMFFLAFGGQLAGQFGTINTLIACVYAFLFQGVLSYVIIRQSSRNGLDIDLLSRGTGFGFMGSAITSIIYWVNFLFYFATEGDIMGHAVSSYFPVVPIWVSFLVVGLVFLPLCLYGMRFMARFQSWSLPLYVALLIAAIVAATLGRGGAHPASIAQALSIAPKSGPSVGGPNLVAAVGAANGLLGIIALLVADFCRFAPKREKGNRRGSLWAAFFPENAMTWLIGLPLGIWFFASINESNPGIYLVSFLGIGGLIFVLLTQTRINVTNIYSGSLALANFFSRAARFTPGRAFWVVVMTLVGTAALFSNVLNYATVVLAFQGVFLLAWLGSIVADIVIVKRVLHLGPQALEYRRAYLVNANVVGLVTIVVASVVGCVLLFGGSSYAHYLPAGTAWAYLSTLAGLVSFVIAMALHPTLAYVTKGRTYLRRPLEAHPGSEQALPCTNCGELVSRTDLVACPFDQQWICAHCCMGHKTCGDKCAHDWPVVNVHPVPIRVGWVGQQPDDARSLGRPGEVGTAR